MTTGVICEIVMSRKVAEGLDGKTTPYKKPEEFIVGDSGVSYEMKPLTETRGKEQKIVEVFHFRLK